MTPQPAELGLSRQLGRRLVPASVLIGLLISLLTPVAYYLLQLQALRHAAAIHAEDVSEQLREVLLESGPLWKYQTTRMAIVRDRVRPETGVTLIAVRDESGQPIAEWQQEAAGPAWWWAPPVEASAPLVFNDRRLGTVEVEVSQGRLPLVAVFLLAGATALGSGLASFVYVYPVKVVRGMEGRIQDLVEALRMSHDELEHWAVDLEAKNAELDSFVYSASHDLRTPLVAVEGVVGTLLEDYSERLDDRGRHYLARLRTNVQQMERLISDLLAISRIGREAHAHEAVDLGEVVDEVLAELAGLLRERGVEVTVKPLVAIWGIRRQVEQVMAHLLSNAITYQRGSEAPEVEVGAEERADWVECWVRDNGIGIDPVYHEKVFEMFERLNEVEAGGTGIGLAIVKKIVEGAGGRVWVESTKGAGATFRFTWPRREARDEEHVAA
jgi:signal transduction histidine kinase